MKIWKISKKKDKWKNLCKSRLRSYQTWRRGRRQSDNYMIEMCNTEDFLDVPKSRLILLIGINGVLKIWTWLSCCRKRQYSTAIILTIRVSCDAFGLWIEIRDKIMKNVKLVPVAKYYIYIYIKQIFRFGYLNWFSKHYTPGLECPKSVFVAFSISLTPPSLNSLLFYFPSFCLFNNLSCSLSFSFSLSLSCVHIPSRMLFLSLFHIIFLTFALSHSLTSSLFPAIFLLHSFS